MRFLLRTLSASYLTRHGWKTLMAILGIAIGIATFVSIKTAQQTLVSGFRSTIDRLAGDADVQITAVGGVPEEVRDTLRALPEVDVEEPVIEQVVQPSPAGLGSLLVFAVDLVGDRALREYAFAGADADVEDPIVFLAQPDSIALSRDFAERAGLAAGDVMTVQIAGVPRRLAVRALLEPRGFARAYGGNVAITDVYAAQMLFGRGRRFDRIEVRLSSTVPLNDGIAAIARALGPGFTVETPARRGEQVERLVASFVGTFNTLSVVALGIGLYTIFNVFTVAVHRRRRDIGILRAVGATPGQVAVLFLSEAALLGLVGSVLGVALGVGLSSRFVAMMGAALAALSGLHEAATPTLAGAHAGEAVAIGVGASLVGAWLPAREAARVPPISAMATGVFRRVAPVSAWHTPVGGGLIAMAYVMGRWHLFGGQPLILFVTITGAVGATMLAGPAARLVIRPLAHVLARLTPASGRMAADALLGHARRTAGTVAVLSVSLAFVLGTAGYLRAIRVAVERWVGNVVTADLVVRASTGLGPTAVRLSASTGDVIARVAGVASVVSYRNERIRYGGRDVALVVVDGKSLGDRSGHEVVAGDPAAFTTALPERGACVISDNFVRRFGVGVGDTLTLDTPSGPLSFPIAAVIVNFISDRGTILIDRSVFVDRWKTDQVDAFHVAIAPGAESARVRSDLRAALASAGPALISTRAEFVAEVRDALDAFQVLITAVVTMALVIALMGVMTSLWVSAVERTRDIGILKALGAGHRQIGGAVVWEALGLVAGSLVLGLPLGSLLSWFLRASVSEHYAGFRFPAAYPVDTLVVVLVALPIVAVLGASLPARWAAGLKVAEAISYE